MGPKGPNPLLLGWNSLRHKIAKLGLVATVFVLFPIGLLLAVRSRRRWLAGEIPRPTWLLFWGWFVFLGWPLWLFGLVVYINHERV